MHQNAASEPIAYTGTRWTQTGSRTSERRSAEHRASTTVMRRFPWLMAFVFGLLHGLGFAGALGALGLPQHAIPLTLFSFNLGIELGQLGVIALLFASAAALLRAAGGGPTRSRLRSLAREGAASAIGALGVFWCLDRAARWLFP